MTAKTKDGIVKVIDDPKFVSRDVVAGAIEIYNGALLNSDASGNIKVGTDAASELFAGMAVEALTQTASASAGDNKIKMIAKGSGKWIRVAMTGVTKANIGTAVTLLDDNTVALAATTTNDVAVGTIRAIDNDVAGYCFVEI